MHYTKQDIDVSAQPISCEIGFISWPWDLWFTHEAVDHSTPANRNGLPRYSDVSDGEIIWWHYDTLAYEMMLDALKARSVNKEWIIAVTWESFGFSATQQTEQASKRDRSSLILLLVSPIFARLRFMNYPRSLLNGVDSAKWVCSDARSENINHKEAMTARLNYAIFDLDCVKAIRSITLGVNLL